MSVLNRSRGVDDEAELDVRGNGAVPRLVDGFGGRGDELNVAEDVVLRAEIDHVLRLLDAADQRAGQLEATANESKGAPGHSALGHTTDHDHGALVPEEVEVHVHVVVKGDAVVDVVQRFGSSAHCLLVRRDHNVRRAHRLGHLDLLRVAGEDGHVQAHRLADLDRHMPEAAQTDHAEVLAGLHPVLHERFVASNTGTQQRRSRGDVHFVGHVENEVLIDDNV
mmetsp:Transcript_9534/g.21902  ORF Transcript_9534/g.21902 Transcript_9534/m.21902 type:complete len:223 (+) Transcript_9534:253-921(+)